MGPTLIFLFGLIFTLCFHHSKLKNFELSDGNRKQEIGVFSFWELGFSVIFVKLSKEWDPPVWLVQSSNVSLQPVLLCLFSFFIFLFLLPRALSSHWPFIAPPQITTTTSIITITSNHHKQAPDWAFVFSLSLSSLCQIGFSLRRFFSLKSFLPNHHHHEQPPRATMRSAQAQPRSVHLCV